MQQPVSGFNQIMREYAARVYNHAHRMLGSREDAEEAVQDVFRKVHAGLSEFRGDAKLSTWIWRITTNVCLTRLSKKRMDAVPVEDGLVDESRAGNPERILMEQEEHERLAGLIAVLDPHEASAINLFYYEEMKYDEISEILGIPPGSVATALHRGREKLRMLCLKQKER
ncbi:MAG: sigma-70 family RNA polymerase sigma factor [Bacteroidota bacterium]